MEVSIRTTAEVMDCAITARVVISYSAYWPYEVRMQISEGSETVEWIFSRELLAEGLEAPPWRAAGDGDVRVWATHGTPPRVIVQLYSPDDGTTRLVLPWKDVARLVQRSYRVVPRGQESRHLDVDRVIRALLGGVP